MTQKLGLIHLYHGDGKGKTTAATGLALRAAGWGYPVQIVQFLKRGDSGADQSIGTASGSGCWLIHSFPLFLFVWMKWKKRPVCLPIWKT